MGLGGSKNQEANIDLADTCRAYTHVSFREESFDNDGEARNVALWYPADSVATSTTTSAEEGENATSTPPPPNTNIAGIVFVSHGLNEHALCYYNIAAELVSQRFIVIGMDHMSHGKSAGRRGIVSDSTRLYRDFVRFVLHYKTKIQTEFSNEDLPVMVFAHSMGTLIAMRALMEDELRYPVVRAAVLSGIPLFAGKAAASPFGCGCLYPLTRTPVAPCLLSVTSVMDPGGPTAPIIVSEICANETYLASLHLDPRRNPPKLTNKTGYELLQLITDLKESIPRKFNHPFFAIHGEKDSIALKVGAEFVFKNATTELTKRKLFVAQNLKHEVIHEADPDGAKCRQMIVDYFVEEAKDVPGGITTAMIEVEA